jgi:gamma-glutamylcyclotransferase (GGCT)/AIG2-like uncharacterized protein YtfP
MGILMFLNGTAMSGQKDHGAVGQARLVGAARTAARYRFIAVRDEFPGLFPVAEGGTSIAGELYEMDEDELNNRLLPGEPPELDLATIELEDGRQVNAMELKPQRLNPDDKIVDIADFGGWRAYQAHLTANADLASVLGLDQPRA